jgi:hypothetical protein
MRGSFRILGKCPAMRFVALMLGAMTIMSLASCGGKPEPVKPVTQWKAYRTEGGGYSMQVPVGWTVTEGGGAGGFETTVKADDDNSIVVSKEILPGGLEGKLMRSDTRDEAIIGAVQSHYRSLEQRFVRFEASAPEVGNAANATAGFGSFTATRKAGFGGKTREVDGATALVIGLNYLYVFDAFADPGSSRVMASAFDHVLDTFKFDE